MPRNPLLALPATFPCPHTHPHVPRAPVPHLTLLWNPLPQLLAANSRLSPACISPHLPSPDRPRRPSHVSPAPLTCLPSHPSPSTRQDDFFILQDDAADSFLETVFKTEFVSLLSKRYEEAARRALPLTFSDTYAPAPVPGLGWAGHSAPSPAPRPRPAWGVGVPAASSSPHRLQFRVKKEGWGGGGTRSVTFSRGSGDVAILKASGRTLTVSVGDGLPKSSSESAQSWGRSQRGGA